MELDWKVGIEQSIAIFFFEGVVQLMRETGLCNTIVNTFKICAGSSSTKKL